MVTRDVHVYANIFFFSFLFLTLGRRTKVVCGSGSVSLGRIPCIEPFPFTAFPLCLFLWWGGSLMYALLIRGSAENSRNWSIAVICGEEVSKQSRRRWDGRDGHPVTLSHFLGEPEGKRRDADRERTSDFSCWQCQLGNTIIIACFTFLDKVTWEFVSLGIIILTDSTKNWLETSDSRACALACTACLHAHLRGLLYPPRHLSL